MYKVHFLNDQEFESLPGQDMETKIGVAYPSKGEAYVRRSGSNGMDVFTALHELEHLEGNSLHEHYDEENKCYYKGFNDVMGPVANVASAIPGPWQIPAMAYSGYNAYQGARNQQQQQRQQSQISGGGVGGLMGRFVDQMSGQIQAPQEATPEVPNVIQAPGTGAGVGATAGSSTGGLRGSLGDELRNRQTPSNAMSPFGNYSGRGGAF